MSIQVNNHGSLDQYSVHEKPQQQGDVCIGTEPAPLVGAAVVEAAAEIDGPAAVQSQLAGQNGTSYLESGNK